MKNVLNVVLNNFTNDSRVLKTSISLQNNGYDVTVVALHEGELLEKESINSVKVNRIKLKTRTWPKVKIVQILKYFEFIIHVARLYKGFRFIHCNDLNALIVGAVLKKLNKNTKIIYDAHEYEINDTPNQSKISIKIKYWIERFFIRYADQVITVSDSIAKEYTRLYSIPEPSLVLNCPRYRETEHHNLFRENLGINENQKIFLYQGSLVGGRGVELLIDAFHLIKGSDKVLVFMGYGSLEPYIKKQTLNSSNIFFHPAVSPDVLLNYTSSADYGISFGEDVCLSYRYSLPNKMFEYLMAGIPILTSNLIEMRRVVEKYQVGIVARENTVSGFIGAVEESLGQARQSVLLNVYAARKKFCWEEQERVLLGIYDGF